MADNNQSDVSRTASIWRKFFNCVNPFKNSSKNYEPFPWKIHDGGALDDVPPNVRLIASFKHEEGHVNSMTATSTGLIYIGCSDKYVWGWNKCEGFGGFDAKGGPVRTITVSQNSCIVSCHEGGTVEFWQKIRDAPPDFVRWLSPLPTLTGVIVNSICRRELNLWRFYFHKMKMTCVSVTDDMRFLYTGSTDCNIYLWRLEDGKLMGCIKGHTQMVTVIAAGGDQLVFSGSEDGILIMWERVEEANIKLIKHLPVQYLLSGTNSSAVNAMLLKSSATGTGELYVGLFNGELMYWTARNAWGASELLPHHHEGGVTCLTRSPGLFVFSGGYDGTICAWRKDPARREHTRVMLMRGHESPLKCIVARDDWEANNEEEAHRCVLYTSCQANILKIWRIADNPLVNVQCGRR